MCRKRPRYAMTAIFIKAEKLTLNLWIVNGRMIRVARKNRINPKVNGVVSSSDHLKIGEVAPQITLARISARIASFAFDNFRCMGSSDRESSSGCHTL